MAALGFLFGERPPGRVGVTGDEHPCAAAEGVRVFVLPGRGTHRGRSCDEAERGERFSILLALGTPHGAVIAASGQHFRQAVEDTGDALEVPDPFRAVVVALAEAFGGEADALE